MGLRRRIRRYRQALRRTAARLRAEREARASAEAAVATKDRLLAAVSHDLRTPLGAITGWAQLARVKSMGRAELDQALSRIEENARLQAVLINDILDLARSASGTLRIEQVPVDMDTVVAKAVEAVAQAAASKQVRIERGARGGNLVVLGDAMRLQQVLWNLLTNAVKFTPPWGRVTVDVVEEGGTVVLRVSDTGRGISAAFLPRVFERFEQGLVGAGGGISGGAGLGLAIVRRLVGMHGGTVKAESAGEGFGATFTVTLPRMMVKSETPGVAAEAGGVISSGSRTARG
jgi:signal transduction histidine kinase